MKKFIYISIILIFSIIPLYANEKKDCSNIKKFSKSYLICKSNNLKKNVQNKTKKTGNPFKKIIDYQKKAWSKQD